MTYFFFPPLFSQLLKEKRPCQRTPLHFLLDIFCPQQKHQFIGDVAVAGPLCEASAIAALLFGWTELPQQTFLNPFTLQTEKNHHFLCWQDYLFIFWPLFPPDFSYNNHDTDNSPLMTVNVEGMKL